MLVLTVAKGPDRGKVFEMRGVSRVVIGRNSTDLRLNDIMISRYHARLKFEGGKWYVRDLGSRNGTKLNGEKLLKPVVLKTGDHIITGYTEFAVSFAPDPVETPATVVAAPSPLELADEPIGAASSAEIGAGLDDLLPGAESGDDLSVHRDNEEESPAAVALAMSEEPEGETVESIDAHAPAVIEPLEHLPVAAAPVEPVTVALAVEPEATLEVAAEVVRVGDLPTVHREEQPVAIEAPAPAVVAPVIEAVDELPPVAPIAAKVTAPAIDVSIETPVTPVEPVAPIVAEIVAAPVVEAKAAALELPPVPAVADIPVAPAAPQGERAASEWMSAIESQLVVAEGQGWDETIDDEDDGFILALDDTVDDLDEDQRVMLYRDEDEHWADDVPLDDEELIKSLKEDGPAALLADIPQRLPKHPVEKQLVKIPAAGKGKKTRRS